MVLTSHGTDLFLLDKIPAARALAGPIFRAAEQVTVISTPLVPRVTALGVAEERVTVVPMPVDESLGAEQGRPRDPRELLFVGRLVERKGAEFALRALAELRRRGVDVRLTIAGDGPERGALESMARELQLGASVEFLGALPTPDVHRLYARAAIFVMPAVTDWKGEQEGFGLVVVEAMRAGMPVVASRSGGIPDIVRDSETGFLVPERDTTALADRLQLLLGDAALARRLGAAAAADARGRFGAERIADTFDRVYARAVEAR
jgi:glycosyltransferase involved in cell wall biosynthesis